MRYIVNNLRLLKMTTIYMFPTQRNLYMALVAMILSLVEMGSTRLTAMRAKIIFPAVPATIRIYLIQVMAAK